MEAIMKESTRLFAENRCRENRERIEDENLSRLIRRHRLFKFDDGFFYMPGANVVIIGLGHPKMDEILNLIESEKKE